MLDRLWTRRLIAIALVTGLLASLTLALAPPSNADVTNPGPLVVTVTGGSLSVNNGNFEQDLVAEDPDPGAVPVTLTGTIDQDGVVVIPAAGVFFPEATLEAAPGLFVDVSIVALTDAIGFINPFTGNARIGLNLGVNIKFANDDTCILTTQLDLQTETAGGTPYDGTDGSMTLVDRSFAVPALGFTPPTAQGLCQAVIAPVLGVPAPGGTNVAIFSVVTDPILEADEGDDPDITLPTLPPTTAPPATTPTSAAPGATLPPAGPAPAGATHLPGGTINPLYTCAGSDAETQTILDLLGDGPLTFNPQIGMAPVSPSPGQGEQFTATFTGAVSLAADLVATVIAVGVTEATVSDLELRIKAGEGVSGDDFVGRPPTRTFQLVSGQPVNMTVGPYDATFTRTSPIGGTVAFVADTLRMTITASLAGSPVVLRLTCTPSGATVLSMTDVSGAPGAGRLPATGNDEDTTTALLAAAMFAVLLGVFLVRTQRRLLRSGPAHLSKRS